MRQKISDAVIRRLPRYRRVLSELEQEGIERTSSGDLAERTNLTASQIRQDLNHFGGFGQQGYGYNVVTLRTEIEKILGVDKHYKVVIIGCGRLGQALANYITHTKRDLEIIAMTDIREGIIGQEMFGLKVLGPEEFKSYIASHKADIGILTMPPETTENAAKTLASFGVKGIWNFSLKHLEVKGVQVSNVHLSDDLYSLIYYMNHPE